MRLLKGFGLRVALLVALVPTAFVMGMGYFRRSRSLPPVIVVCCVDKRYSENPRLWNEVPAGYCWRWPGCAKKLVENDSQREDFFQEVYDLRKAGIAFTKIILVDHCDCRGYGAEDSREKHCTCLRKAKALIEGDVRVADLPVELYLHDFERNVLDPVES